LEGIQLEDIANWLVHNIVQVLLILSLFIEFTPPIKWNPWTTLIKWVGKLINGELTKKVDNLAITVDQIQKDRNEDEKDRIRWEILDFANSCRNGRRHTKDEFEHIVVLHDKYVNLLKKTNDKNGYFDLEYAYIERIYKRCQDKNDFLTIEGDE